MSRSLLIPGTIAALALLASACEGPAGPAGPAGADGADGADGQDGANGADGIDGSDGLDGTDGSNGLDGTDGTDGTDGMTGSAPITSFHGTDFMRSSGDYALGKEDVTVEITAADAADDGTLTVDFTVTDDAGNPVGGIVDARFAVASLEPASGDYDYNRWVPYVYETEEVLEDGEWPNPAGTAVDQAAAESEGTLTDNGGGSYSYTFATNVAAVVTDVGGEAITYDRARTHRVAVMLGGHDGPTGDAWYDWVPDGSELVETRDIIDTAACQACHGESFAGHDGDRSHVEVCAVCHTADNTDAQSGESLDLKQMIHRIHSGGELPTIPGDDGIVWDDPATAEDESADNGSYAIWGDGDVKHEWWDVRFPAVRANCVKCHNGDGTDVDNYLLVPSRAACGSCHADVDYSTGDNHPGGVMNSDTMCTYCHSDSSIETYHFWTDDDPRNAPEFTVELSVSTPANGMYFEPGESPVVTIAVSDDSGLIDHTTVVEDDAAEGCLEGEDPCPTRDGKFDRFYLFVEGPRAARNPVLSTASHVEAVSADSGPFDISAASSLDLVFDAGVDVRTRTETFPGTVSVPVDSAAFANLSAATTDELATWLNDDADFVTRAWAFVDDAGDLVIRDRNLGTVFSLQLLDGELTDRVFDGDTSVHVAGGYYARNDLVQHSDPADDDPLATWDADAITYQLDDVEDLLPGTYTVSVEIADAGRNSDDDYVTPTVGWTTFQVGQEDEELPIAGNCDTCHQSDDGQGYVLDFPRHNKQLGDDAISQCGACHDYQPQTADGADWGGALPISKRIHAVHMGANLAYPTDTVGHDDIIAGRNWEIQFPQDIRYCETCHPADSTSGSWATDANRLACGGCHDTDAAVAHMELQTVDPTPDAPFSGDEEESCAVCH